MAFAAGGVVLRAADPAPSQPGFSVPYKEGGRLVARFSGAKSEPLSLEIVRITGFRVETFAKDGAPELVGEGPECTLNLKTKEASSPGPLTVTQLGGRLKVSGEGFSWSQANGRLVLSNRVHTVFHLNGPSPLLP